MTKYTKLIMLAIALMCAVSAFAQPERRWGITVGGNYNEIHFKQSDIFDSDPMFGGSIGVTGDLMIPGIGFGIDGSILYTLRQGKVHMLGSRKALRHRQCDCTTSMFL